SPAEAVGAVAVPPLDAALGVAAVAAHVPLSGRARDAPHGIGPAHDADDEIAGREAATLGCRLDRAQRFMAENEALLTGRRKAVTTLEDFAVGPAHSQRQGAHQSRAVRLRWFGDLLEPRRVGGAGRNGDCAHPALGLPRIRVAAGALAARRGKALGASSGDHVAASRQNAIDIFTPDAKKSSGGAKRKSGRPRYRF